MLRTARAYASVSVESRGGIGAGTATFNVLVAAELLELAVGEENALLCEHGELVFEISPVPVDPFLSLLLRQPLQQEAGVKPVTVVHGARP